MAYTPPAGDAVHFDFTGGTAYTPPAGDAVHFDFTGEPSQRSRLGITWRVDSIASQRSRLGITWSTDAAASQRSRLGITWQVSSDVASQRSRLGITWATEAVANARSRLGITWATFSYTAQRSRLGITWKVQSYESKLCSLGIYWGFMSEVARQWRLVTGDEVSREWRLPSPIYGPEVARQWRLSAAYEGVARQWTLPSPLYTEVARQWRLPSKAVSEVARQWSLDSTIAEVNEVSRQWRLHSAMVDKTMMIPTAEAYALVDLVYVPLLDVECNNDEGQFGWTSTITLARVEDYDLFRPETHYDIVLGGEDYAMVLDSKQKSRGSVSQKTMTVSGISPCARYAEPRATMITKTWLTPTLASDLAAELFPDEAIDWTVTDWSIPAPRLAASNESPRNIMQRVLAAAGALLECNKDGTLKVRYRYPISVPAYATATPDQVYTDADHNFSSDEGIQLASLVNKLRIMDVATSGFQDRIEFIPSTSDPTRGVLRVWPSPYRLTFEVGHTSLPIVSVALIGEQTEQLTETVEVVGGKGSVAKPIYSIDSFQFLYDDCGGIVFETDKTEFTTTSTELTESLVEITYTTRFVAYDAVAWLGAKVQFVVREPESA